MDITEMLLDSWDRQCEILSSLRQVITEENRAFKPSEDGWPLDLHLAHVHSTRSYFLRQVAPDLAEGLPSAHEGESACRDLDRLFACLAASSEAVRKAVGRGLEKGGPLKGGWVVYENPVLLLQHMVWHEGWHTGLILLALRKNGQEPPDEWEEREIWGRWRTEVWEESGQP